MLVDIAIVYNMHSGYIFTAQIMCSTTKKNYNCTIWKSHNTAYLLLTSRGVTYQLPPDTSERFIQQKRANLFIYLFIFSAQGTQFPRAEILN